MVVSSRAKVGLPFHRLPVGIVRPSMNPHNAGLAGGRATELAKSSRLRYDGKMFGGHSALAAYLGIHRKAVYRLVLAGEVEVVEAPPVTLPPVPWAPR